MQNYEIPISKIKVVALLVVLLMSILLNFAKYYPSDYMNKIILYFIGISVPAALLGLSISENHLEAFYQKFRYVNIYLTFCLSLTLFRGDGSESGMINDVAGASHLFVGYTMSGLFAFNLLQFINNKKILSKLFYLVLMALNIMLIVYSGSRGSLVSIVLIFLISASKFLLNKRRIIILPVLALFAFGVVKIISANQNYGFAIDRVLSGLSSSQDQSTQERFNLYKIAIQSFEDSPLFGKGIGSFSNAYGQYYYPHNIVLEILNDFGLIGIIVALLISIFTFKKCRKLLKADLKYHLIVFLFINCFTEFLFSGTYVVSNQLWMLISIIWVIKSEESFIKDKIQVKSLKELKLNNIQSES